MFSAWQQWRTGNSCRKGRERQGAGARQRRRLQYLLPLARQAPTTEQTLARAPCQCVSAAASPASPGRRARGGDWGGETPSVAATPQVPRQRWDRNTRCRWPLNANGIMPANGKNDFLINVALPFTRAFAGKKRNTRALRRRALEGRGTRVTERQRWLQHPLHKLGACSRFAQSPSLTAGPFTLLFCSGKTDPKI